MGSIGKYRPFQGLQGSPPVASGLITPLDGLAIIDSLLFYHRCDASISRLSAEVKTTQESIQNLAKEQKSSNADVECKIKHIEIQISRVLGKIEQSVAQQEAKIKANQEDSSHQLHLLEDKLEGVSEDLKGQSVSVQNSLEKEQERAVTECLTKIEQLSLVIKEQTDKNDKIVEERYGQLSMKLDKIEEVQKMNLGSHRVKHAEEKENDRINKIEKEIWKEIQDMRAETNAGTPYAVVGRNNVEGTDTSEPYSVVRLAPESCSQEKGDGMNPEWAEPYSVKIKYRNKLLGEHDIPLTCIEQVVTVNDTKRKQKVLGSNQKLKFNPTELIIYCKDFRIVRFRFDEAGPESAKKVCLAIAHYSQPADPQLLFGFEYVGKRYYNPAGDKVNGVDPGGGGDGGGGGVDGVQTPLFDRSSDWDREIKRTGGSEWRVCSINESYVISLRICNAITRSHPQRSDVYKSDLDKSLPTIQDVQAAFVQLKHICVIDPFEESDEKWLSSMESTHWLEYVRICNAITRSHPQRSDVYKSDLDKSLPTIQDVQAAFVRLKHICVIDPFEESDEKWLSSMESTHWLEYVRSFLKHSAELVYMLDGKHVSVILQEEEDRDLNCVISSLVQVMLDPHFRSIAGFQSLVQKEWVMAGYRFLDRCNHLKKSDKVESPLFLLFLDCVWQLLDQYPAAFEFTETYLTVLSDSLWIPVFSTFLFNCPQQRAEHSREFARSKNIHLGDEKVLQFPSVWDWSQQFTAKDQALFNNPLYVGKSATCVQNGAVKTFKRTKKNYSSTLRGMPSLRNGLLSEQELIPRRNSLVLRLKPEFSLLKEPQESPSDQYIREWFSKPADLQGLILPQLLSSHIKVWKLCFLRWIPEAQINNGGYITAFHKVSVLADEIEMLQNRLRQYKGTPSTPGGSPETERCKMYFRASNLSDTSPTPEYLTSSFPFSPVGNLCRRSILGTPLSKFLSGAKIWISTETLANETL
ncbi:UNVERIFIED_CONTAM: hypothetical protein FKN15_050858 [Acipenser sinensis]